MQVASGTECLTPAVLHLHTIGDLTGNRRVGVGGFRFLLQKQICIRTFSLEDRYIVVGFFDNQLLHFDRIVKQCNKNCIENIRNGPSTHCPKLFQQNFSAKLLDKSLDCFRQLYFSGEQRLLIIFISFSSICCTIDTKLLATNKTIKLKCSKCSKTKSITYCG